MLELLLAGKGSVHTTMVWWAELSFVLAPAPVYTKNEIYKPKNMCLVISSTLAQRKRDGPITHRSLDRNQQVLRRINFAVNVQK